MKQRRRRILQVGATLVVAVCGFIAAGALTGAGFAGDTTSSSTTSSSSSSSSSSTTSSSTSTTTSTTTTTTTTTTGTEGCTPGYWKQPQHFDSWPVDTTTTLADAGFVGTGHDASTTLLQALSFQGGPTIQDAKDILLRIAAAAYLNSLSVDYPLSSADVVSMVNAALATNDRETILDLAETLDAENNLGCPLN
jgi:hypothetical protein